MKVLFLSSMPNRPTGGIRVIYNYVNILNALGYESYVLHPLKSYYYRYADTITPVFKLNKISSLDHIVIPDDYIGRSTRNNLKNHKNYSIFIQNPYIIRTVQRHSNKELINKIFDDAKYILCISDDSVSMISLLYPQVINKIVRTIWSLPYTSKLKLDVSLKEKIITYMPRKNIDHIQLVVDAIEKKLPKDWTLLPLKGLSRIELERKLNFSSIHLTFGSFEGLPAPPVEAALAGNFVLGYHGNGGKEYWLAPNFTEINVCDIQSFCCKVISKVNEIEMSPYIFESLKPGIECLHEKFSLENEKKCLTDFITLLSDQSTPNVSQFKYKTPFSTNYLSYQVDRFLTKYKQLLGRL